MTTEVLILGAGFGGLELTARLSEELGDDVHVTLIDRSESFVFGFAKLDVMFGRTTGDAVRLPYSAIERRNVTFRREAITAIDPRAKAVTTDAGTYQGDVLVIALGADLQPEHTEGLVESGHEFYSPEGAERLAALLPDFQGGRVVIGVLGGHFKCPPAPYECAFMLHDYLSQRGRREATTIHLVTPMPSPIPVSRTVSGALLEGLDERGITHAHGSWVERLDPGTVHLRDGRRFGYDLFLAVPKHVAPPVVVESGLTEDDGWIAVDPATLETKWPGVFAVGDVASAPLPRAGVVAEGEASTVADVLLHRLAGAPDPAPYAGAITCYIEMGAGLIGRVDVDFLSGPRPHARFAPPSTAGVQEKAAFAARRRKRWFGLGEG